MTAIEWPDQRCICRRYNTDVVVAHQHTEFGIVFGIADVGYAVAVDRIVSKSCGLELVDVRLAILR
jgi:hypothetical protein